jgi:hypothetical protein
MTREDFVDWMKAYGCQQELIEGINVTAWEIKFVNPKTGRHIYMKTPINEKELPDYFICHNCNTLGIPIPDCVVHEDERYKSIKDNIGKKRRK